MYRSDNKIPFYLFIISVLSSVLVFVSADTLTFAAVGFTLSLVLATHLIFVNKLISPKYIVICLCVIWIVYLFHWVITPPSIVARASILAYIISSVVWILVVPSMISRRVFIDTIALLGPIFMVVGLPSVIDGSYSIGMFEITAFHNTIDFPIEIGIYQMSSIFHNPNPFGVFMLGSTLCSINYFTHRRSTISVIPLFLSSIGLFMSNSRGAIAGAIAGLFIIFVYHYGGRTNLGMITAAGVISSILFMLSVTQIIPTSISDTLSLTGRDQIWRGTMRAILNRPILGYGPGDLGSYTEPFTEGPYAGRQPHNSYLRLFLTTGVIGGIAYLILIGKTIFDAVKVITEDSEIIIFGVFCGILVNQLFAGDSLFGLSSSSALGAMALGFCAKFVLMSRSNNH